jgi:hypothetical protein
MRLYLPICLACFFALLAAPARADQPVNDPTLAQYMEIAKAYWGGPEPHCTESDGTVIPPYAVMGNDPNPNVAAWAEIGGCRIWLDSDFWPAPPSEEYCNLIAHEWGHLTGRHHSTDSSDLMWPQWTNNVVPQCAEFRHSGLGPPPSARMASSHAHHHTRKAHRARRACMAARKRARHARRRLDRLRIQRRGCLRRGKRRQHRHQVARGSLPRSEAASAEYVNWPLPVVWLTLATPRPGPQRPATHLSG